MGTPCPTGENAPFSCRFRLRGLGLPGRAYGPLPDLKEGFARQPPALSLLLAPLATEHFAPGLRDRTAAQNTDAGSGGAGLQLLLALGGACVSVMGGIVPTPIGELGVADHAVIAVHRGRMVLYYVQPIDASQDAIVPWVSSGLDQHQGRGGPGEERQENERTGTSPHPAPVIFRSLFRLFLSRVASTRFSRNRLFIWLELDIPNGDGVKSQ